MADDFEVMVRPCVNEKRAIELAQRLWGIHGRKIIQLNGYDDKNFWIQDAEILGHPSLTSVHEPGYVLKVMNSLDSKNEDEVVDQNTILQNLAKNGVECPQPQPTINGTLYSAERLEPDGPLHVVRLLSFVPGKILNQVPWNPRLAYQAGQMLARIDNILEFSTIKEAKEIDAFVDRPLYLGYLDLCLQSTSAPALKKKSHPWSLWSATKCLRHIHVIESDADRSMVIEVLSSFENKLLLRRETLCLKESLIHGDFNEQNIVVRQDNEGAWSIAAVLDLGDSHQAPVVFEVALAAAYMGLRASTLGDEAAEAAYTGVVSGYKEAGGRIPETEAKLLKLCICARLAQSLVNGLKSYQENPANEYVLSTQRFGWCLLRQFWESCKESYCSASVTERTLEAKSHSASDPTT